MSKQNIYLSNKLPSINFISLLDFLIITINSINLNQKSKKNHKYFYLKIILLILIELLETKEKNLDISIEKIILFNEIFLLVYESSPSNIRTTSSYDETTIKIEIIFIIILIINSITTLDKPTNQLLLIAPFIVDLLTTPSNIETIKQKTIITFIALVTLHTKSSTLEEETIIQTIN